MEQDELWKIFCDKNPAFESQETITLTKAGLKKLFDQTWDQAYQEGFAKGAASKSVFESLFGK